jgi:hypothetical protein
MKEGLCKMESAQVHREDEIVVRASTPSRVFGMVSQVVT